MHSLTLIGSDDDPQPRPPAFRPPLHGLYVAPGPGGTSRAVIARDGRILLEIAYDSRDLSDDDLRALHQLLTSRRRAG